MCLRCLLRVLLLLGVAGLWIELIGLVIGFFRRGVILGVILVASLLQMNTSFLNND